MRILYGVVGEGMGHATRSRVVLEHLIQQGHEVHIVVSGRAKDYLAKRFENVHGIWGFTIEYEGNSVKKWQTLLQNLKGAISGWPQNVKQYFEIADSFAPDVVISDFESFSYLFARNHFLPVISIDNMQVINRCKHDPALIAGHEEQFELTKGLVKSKLPGSFAYLVTTFFEPPIRKERTTLLPPILRPEILSAKRERGEHLLVYQTMSKNTALIEALAASGKECHIYGFRRDITTDVREGNLLFRPFSETGFIDDLRSCQGVIGGGGFTLMSEAVYLQKPMLSIPIEGQFEQVMNALYLQQLGYGKYAKSIEGQVLSEFLESIPQCEQSLTWYHQDGNKKLLNSLDATLISAQERKGTWSETTSH